MALLILFYTVTLWLGSNGQYATSCGGWCRNIDESSSCDGCNGTSNCVTIPESECEPGDWPYSNDQTGNDTWLYSRSTHYGGTSGGACGYHNVPNCYSNDTSKIKGSKRGLLQDCSGVPDEIINSPFAGLYAAPQGDYYAQSTYIQDGQNFLSCGACFEIRCTDPVCTYSQGIYINIADSCPCHPNPKWCCNVYSHCNELRNDTLTGQPHCYQSSNGVWGDYSLHLDLSDLAFAKLTSGDIHGSLEGGVVNTLMRRVSCPVTGNAYVMIDTSSVYMTDCYTVYPDPSAPCFYYLAVNPYNLAGYGTVRNVFVNAGRIVSSTPDGRSEPLLMNQTMHERRKQLDYDRAMKGGVSDSSLVYGNFSLLRNPNFPSNKSQEQFGNWVNAQNMAIFLPIQFFVEDGAGRIIGSEIISDFGDSAPEWLDVGTNFEAVDAKLLNTIHFHGH